MRHLFLTLLVGLILSPVARAQIADPAQDIRDADESSSYQTLMEMRESEARMQKLIESMRNEMVKLAEAKDRRTRQQHMSQHRAYLHEILMLLRQTGGGSPLRIIDQHTRPGGVVELSPSGRTLEDVQLLSRRVDMMQMALEALLEHVSMQGSL